MILVMQNTAEMEKRLEQQRGGKLLRGLGKSGIRSRDKSPRCAERACAEPEVGRHQGRGRRVQVARGR